MQRSRNAHYEYLRLTITRLVVAEMALVQDTSPGNTGVLTTLNQMVVLALAPIAALLVVQVAYLLLSAPCMQQVP